MASWLVKLLRTMRRGRMSKRWAVEKELEPWVPVGIYCPFGALDYQMRVWHRNCQTHYAHRADTQHGCPAECPLPKSPPPPIPERFRLKTTGNASSAATTPGAETPHSTKPGSPPSPARGASGKDTTGRTVTGQGHSSASTRGPKSSATLASKILKELQQMIHDSSEKLSRGGRA